MNRVLYWSSVTAPMLAVSMCLAWLLGYTIGNLIVVLISLPLFTAIASMFLTFMLVVIGDTIASILVFSIRSVAPKNETLRKLTRKFLEGINDPPDWFFLLLLIGAATMAIRFVATVDSAALTSPGMPADIFISSIFWALLSKLDGIEQR